MNKKKIVVYILLCINLIAIILNAVLSILYKKNYDLEMIMKYIILISIVVFLFLYIREHKDKLLHFNISLILLIIYNVLLLNGTLDFINISYFKKMPDFSNKKYTEVLKWASSNNIVVKETYEYSDITKENNVIYQDIKVGETLNNVDILNIVVSSGKNPEKELVIPDMSRYNLDKVLEYIENNNLSNVKLEYETSDYKEDDLIKQSKIGSMKRNDEIVFTFSRGNNELQDEVKLIDFTNLTKLRAIAYLTKYGINYEFEEENSDTIKKGNIVKQSITKGNSIKRNEEVLKLTLSKGNKIKVPNLKNMTLDEISEWATKNNIKLDISKKYDDSIKEGKIIDLSANENDSIGEGETIKILISQGKIVMKDFSELSKFEEWITKYNIPYTIEYQFSDTIENGKIIEFSHKAGDTIKNDDTITVTVSSGKKTTVPSFIGMSIQNIKNKCNSSNLNCIFQYQNNTKIKDTALRQSISAGSEVAVNTTISIILSNGKTYVAPTPTPAPEQKVETCTPQTITLTRDLNNIFSSPESYQSTVNKLTEYFKNKNVKVNIVADTTSGKAPGAFVGGIGPGSSVKTCCPNDCQAYTITVAK